MKKTTTEEELAKKCLNAIDEAKTCESIYKEIKRQFGCHLAFSSNRRKTLNWCKKTCYAIITNKNWKKEILKVISDVNGKRLHEEDIPDYFQMYFTLNIQIDKALAK